MARSGPRLLTGRRPLVVAALLVLLLAVIVLVRAAGDGPTGTATAGSVAGAPSPSAAPSPSTPGSPTTGSATTGSATTGSATTGSATTPADPSGDAVPVEPAPAAPPDPDGTTPSAGRSTTFPDRAGASPSAADPAPPAPAPDQAAATLAAVADAGAAAEGTVHAVVLGPDGTELLASPGADEPEWTASLSKTLLVSQLLDDDGVPVLGPEDLQLVERALTSSDDEAMNTLWTRFDGPALVTEAATDFGLGGTAAPTEVSQWGEATTTARDYALFLHRLGLALDPAALAPLTGWLQSTTATAADGFDQTFGLLAPAVGAEGPVAAKQGWMCCVDDRRQLHSAGSLDDGRVVVLLGDFPSSTGWDGARTALETAARAVISGTAG